MLKSIKATAAGLVLVAVSALASCQSEPATTTPATAAAPSTAPATAPVARVAAYVCPMNCEGSASDKPGKCPVCGMDLEPNPAAAQSAAAGPDSL
ncbi:heavy metal-binding domain-containing protein [Hymenobacter sp. DG25A]|uniref:heavy metal-binding domain-containing protein n=1 Tax=Hymenobacter sp. DG25A TaxID=1385663 RepID=UPI0006BDAED9|nr:heavy metal-binding domain-containing protein [Hymenobacter sp. DG25A]ALD22235.1 hypothetical protein AM218_14705 [Hymenobacter sp. DG25A]